MWFKQIFKIKVWYTTLIFFLSSKVKKCCLSKYVTMLMYDFLLWIRDCKIYLTSTVKIIYTGIKYKNFLKRRIQIQMDPPPHTLLQNHYKNVISVDNKKTMKLNVHICWIEYSHLENTATQLGTYVLWELNDPNTISEFMIICVYVICI